MVLADERIYGLISMEIHKRESTSPFRITVARSQIGFPANVIGKIHAKITKYVNFL
jgi:hypothetical protein